MYNIIAHVASNFVAETSLRMCPHEIQRDSEQSLTASQIHFTGNEEALL